MLRIENLNAGYGDTQVIWDINLQVGQGEIVTLIGPNGAGKSTIIKAIMGLIKPISGSIIYNNENIVARPAYDRAKLGIACVPEGRRLFPKMTVSENLDVAAWKREGKEETLKWVFELLPRLYERKNQIAGTLSGGEQQMLAVARGIMAKPNLLILDEPSLGLAPMIVEEIFQLLLTLNKEGITVFFVEQFVEESLKISNRGYLCEQGKIVYQDESSKMLGNDYIRKVYMGVAD